MKIRALVAAIALFTLVGFPSRAPAAAARATQPLVGGLLVDSSHQRLYLVGNAGGVYVEILDLRTGQLEYRLTFPGAMENTTLTVDDHGLIYVGVDIFRGNPSRPNRIRSQVAVYVIDPTSGGIARRILLTPLSRRNVEEPLTIAANDALHRVYLLTLRSLYTIDTLTERRLAVVALRGSASPFDFSDGLAVDQVTGEVWVPITVHPATRSRTPSGEILGVGGTTGAIARVIKCRCDPRIIGFDPVDRHLIVDVVGGVMTFDTGTGSLLRRVPALIPGPIEVDEATNRAVVLVEDFLNAGGTRVRLLFLDTRTGALIRRHQEWWPRVDDRMAVDSATHSAFVAPTGGNSIRVYDMVDGRLIRTIGLGKRQVFDLAIDSSTHRLVIDTFSGIVFRSLA